MVLSNKLWFRYFVVLAGGILAGAMIYCALRPTGENKTGIRPAPETASAKARTGGGSAGMEVSAIKNAGKTGRFVAEIEDGPNADNSGPNETRSADTTACINAMLDKKESAFNRRSAAWKLTEEPGDEAMTYLEAILLDAENSPGLKATVLEGLGRSGRPEAQGLLVSALSEQDETVVAGAIRGLGRIGNEQTVDILSTMVGSKGSTEVVSEAANALGQIELSSAGEKLKAAYRDGKSRGDADFQKTIIEALGRRHLRETEELFREMLNEDSAEVRLAAVEAMENAGGDASDLLVAALKDKSPEVRAAAAWTLSVRNDRDELAGDIAIALRNEKDPDVRTRLYQAMEGQKSPNLSVIMPAVLGEQDSSAKLAGNSTLAGIINKAGSAENISLFDSSVVPDLTEVALNDAILARRLAAVAALKKANTAGADRALEEIFVNTGDLRVANATGLTVPRLTLN